MISHPRPCPLAYAWILEDGSVCCWAEPSREQLKQRSDPGGAEIRAVHLVPVAEYRKLRRALWFMPAEDPDEEL